MIKILCCDIIWYIKKGGERTRTSIGIELVTNPDIIILDEPTSGLDSASAYNTMMLLKQLTNKGKTVIACIHQPSSEIFASIGNFFYVSITLHNQFI